jgi:hypothetical protein
MDVREEGNHREDRDEIELNLVVHHPFGQRVQPEEENADAQHRRDQDNSHEIEKPVCLTGSRYEGRQMM